MKKFSTLLLTLILLVVGNNVNAKENDYNAPPASLGYDLSFSSISNSFSSLNSLNPGSFSSIGPGKYNHRFVIFYTENGRRCSKPISTRSNPETVGLIRKMKLHGTCGPAPARVKDSRGRIIGIILESKKRFYYGPETILYLDPRLLPDIQNSNK